ncbi:hypothetical protein FRC07_002365 [Ceratobasidium sp. 392]|nr:hypothetical protein FRC07_002365 [Ceratobasidium sp. 392]
MWQQARKKRSNKGLLNRGKAWSSAPVDDHNTRDYQISNHSYSPAEFRALVLEELEDNCLEWDVSRVRVVSATFYGYSSGVCSIRLDLQGELGRFSHSRVLALHPPPPRDSANKRRLIPEIPRTKRNQMTEGLDSASHGTTNASGQSKHDISQSADLLPHATPSDPMNSECASAVSSTTEFQSADSPVLMSPHVGQTVPLTETTRPSTTKSTPPLDLILSPAGTSTSGPNHGRDYVSPTETPTTRDGMNVLPDDFPAQVSPYSAQKISLCTRPPDNISAAYSPAVLAPSNRNVAAFNSSPGKLHSDWLAPISSANPLLGQFRDQPPTPPDFHIPYDPADDRALAPRSVTSASGLLKRGRSSSTGPNNIDVLSKQTHGELGLVIVPLLRGPPRNTVKQQMAGVATGAFRVWTRTAVDLKENVGRKPRTGYFRITDTELGNTCLSPLTREVTTTMVLPKGDRLITLEDVAILAFTIASRASRHSRVIRSENWFLDAMWEGFHLIIGSRQTDPDHPDAVDAGIKELLEDVMSRFPGEVIRFRRQISQIREREDPRGAKRQELQKMMWQLVDQAGKEIREKIKSNDALAKENEALASDIKRLKEEEVQSKLVKTRLSGAE